MPGGSPIAGKRMSRRPLSNPPFRRGRGPVGEGDRFAVNDGLTENGLGLIRVPTSPTRDR